MVFQAGIAVVGIGAELVHIAEALVERLLNQKGREASIADGLITVELYLEGLVPSTRADEVRAEIAACPDLLLNAKVVLIVVRGLERPAREGVRSFTANGQVGAPGWIPRQGASPDRKLVWRDRWR